MKHAVEALVEIDDTGDPRRDAQPPSPAGLSGSDTSIASGATVLSSCVTRPT